MVLAVAALRLEVRAGALALVAVAGLLNAALALREERRCGLALAERSEVRAVLEDDAAPGGSARATVRAGDCSAGALVLVERGRARAGEVVLVHGRLLPATRGVVVQRARLRVTGQRAPLASLRARARRIIDRVFRDDAPLVRALLVADAREIPTATRDRFAASGLVHVLSISGLHVAIVAEAVLLLLRAARASRRRAAVLAIVAIGGYLALLGLPPPATRAGVMLAVRELGTMAQRPVSPWAALALGALAPLLIDPRAATDLGWQLSVAGMASLVASGVLVRRTLAPRMTGVRLTIARELAAGTLATLATAPLVAFVFGRVSVVGPIANLFAAPIVAILQPALFLAMALAPVEPLARVVADASHLLLRALDLVARAAAAVPGASPAVAPTLATTALLAAAAAALVAACSVRRPAPALVAGAVALATAAWLPFVPRPHGRLELHMIDVGQGDAIALRTPRGRWVLFDAGRSWRGGDAGRTTVVPYLRRRGGALAAFVLSHPHADHVGGAASVLRAMRPAEYWDAAFAGSGESYRASLAVADSLGTAWRRVDPGDSLALDGVSIRFLAPDSAWTARLRDPNLASTVALVRFGLVRILLVGDAERPQEEWLLATSRDSLRADVLKVAHHGSRTSSGDAFLDAVQPRLALVPVGLGNVYGHPSREVLERFASRGTTVLRTDELGSVVVRTDGREITLEALGVEWSLSGGSSPP